MAERKAVIFDMDGVIFDSETLVLDSWRIVADRHGIPRIVETCYSCLGTNSAATKSIFLEQYGSEFPYDDYKEQMSQVYRQAVGEGKLALKPGLLDLLSYLKEHDYKIGLASSTRKAVVEWELELTGILGWFDYLTCGDMLLKSKPEPDIYLMACDSLKVSPSHAFAIEDSYNGIRSASSAGLHAIMVPDLIPPDDEMRRLAKVILPSLREVIPYLSESQGGRA